MRILTLYTGIAVFGVGAMCALWSQPAPAAQAGVADSCDLPGAPANCKNERVVSPGSIQNAISPDDETPPPTRVGPEGVILNMSSDPGSLPDSTHVAPVDASPSGATPITNAAINLLNAAGATALPSTDSDSMFDNPQPPPVATLLIGSPAPGDPNFVGPPAPPTDSADTMFDNPPEAPAGDIATTTADTMFDTPPPAPPPNSNPAPRHSAPAPTYQPRPVYGDSCGPGAGTCH